MSASVVLGKFKASHLASITDHLYLDESTEGCDVLANPPDEDSDCEQMEFELLEEEPFDTYLIQPTESIG